MTRTPTPHVSRRTTIKALAAALGLTGTSLGTYALTTGRARATVSANDLTVSDGEYVAEDSGPAEVWLAIGGQFSFDVSVTVDQWRVRLHVSTDGTNWQLMAATGEQATGDQQSGSYTLRAPLTRHAALDDAALSADAGETVEHRLYVRVTLDVLDAADSVLASATANDAATVTVTNESVAATLGIEGSGAVAFQNESGSGTPTVPG